MSQAPVSATLFAYQVGFGDCFLLRFSYADGDRRHMLIDFGTTGLPDDVETSRMYEVALDIQKKVTQLDGAARLDVVVATHRHADHISGFAKRADGRGPGNVIRDLKPRVVVQPWTEAPDAELDSLGPTISDSPVAFAKRLNSLKAMQEVAGAALDYAQRTKARRRDKEKPDPVGDQLEFIGRDNLSNLSAVENLMTMGERNAYVFHGCDVDLGAVLPGIEVDVLGPPTLRQTDTIRKQRSRDKDEFWHLAPKRFKDAVDDFSGDSQSLFPKAKVVTKLYSEHRWLAKRLDEANGELLLGLVRALDDQMNNTSVILLLRAGSKTLLFPGDAQIENWQYALQSSLADRLADVDLYKVGHHGSLNATPKGMWKRFRKKGAAETPGRLTSVLSTKHGKHGKDEKNTEVPRRTLVAELDANSDLISTERLAPEVLYREIEIDLTSAHTPPPAG